MKPQAPRDMVKRTVLDTVAEPMPERLGFLGAGGRWWETDALAIVVDELWDRAGMDAVADRVIADLVAAGDLEQRELESDPDWLVVRLARAKTSSAAAAKQLRLALEG